MFIYLFYYFFPYSLLISRFVLAASRSRLGSHFRLLLSLPGRLPERFACISMPPFSTSGTTKLFTFEERFRNSRKMQISAYIRSEWLRDIGIRNEYENGVMHEFDQGYVAESSERGASANNQKWFNQIGISGNWWLSGGDWHWERILCLGRRWSLADVNIFKNRFVDNAI